MPKLTKRVVDAAKPMAKDYIIWDDGIPGFGLRILKSGRRSYIIQYRAAGRSRRFTIGVHGIWTPEKARQEAMAQLGRVARGDDPAEERVLDRNAITVKELSELYIADMEKGLILGKGGRPKKASTIATDIGRLRAHITPLIGPMRVKDVRRSHIIKVLRDIMSGTTRAVVKSKKLRGKSVITGGPGTATRTVGVLGATLSYAIELGIIEHNPAHGIKKPKGNVRDRRLSEAEYHTLGNMLRDAEKKDVLRVPVDIIRQIALTGCRRSEIIKLKWVECDLEGSCLRLAETKEGASVRPVGLSVVEFLERIKDAKVGPYVFPGRDLDSHYGYFQTRWKQMFDGSPLAGITPHVLRHSFASVANDLGFTEITIASLIGHAKGSITGRYIHTLDTALLMAADNISGYIAGLLDGVKFKQNSYALDRSSRKAALARFLSDASGDATDQSPNQIRLVA
ncbi:MAG: tyrosine-type recombinase/integrase [Sphingopyxis sp.]